MAVAQNRIGAIFAMLFALLALAGLRIAYLGVFRGAALRNAASAQQITNETVTAQRGTITDRNGVDLAVSEPAKDLSADPYLLHDPLAAAQRLAARWASRRTRFCTSSRSGPASSTSRAPCPRGRPKPCSR